jgi:hypothetical protein
MSCKCQSCGKQYKIDLMIPDELWNRPTYIFTDVVKVQHIQRGS